MNDETFRVFQNRSELNVIFVHSELDDRNLTLAEFRIYCHLARRAGNGVAYPGIDSMSVICRLSKNTVVAAIKSLEWMGMIQADRKSGMSTRYILTAKSQWKSLDTIANEGTVATIPNEVTERPKRGNATVPNEVTKGNPTKDIQKGTPSAAQKEQAETIYSLYPRKVGKPTSIKAIVKVFKKHPFEHVKERVEAFAKAWDGGDLTYCPHPATWFNQERFNDTPEEWTRAKREKSRETAKKEGGPTPSGPQDF